ncbi:hypothetical protein AYI69_g8233 [Smittium culicis]|uniref:Uncharacterized protein n=1 Tax=Smittium culicis TaxID=133412 RepID=A0A1R1XL47_9FUNG|nr:hypothetical protein AYI69_g8233 [Smittium culicis]
MEHSESMAKLRMESLNKKLVANSKKASVDSTLIGVESHAIRAYKDGCLQSEKRAVGLKNKNPRHLKRSLLQISEIGVPSPPVSSFTGAKNSRAAIPLETKSNTFSFDLKSKKVASQSSEDSSEKKTKRHRFDDMETIALKMEFMCLTDIFPSKKIPIEQLNEFKNLISETRRKMVNIFRTENGIEKQVKKVTKKAPVVNLTKKSVVPINRTVANQEKDATKSSRSENEIIDHKSKVSHPGGSYAEIAKKNVSALKKKYQYKRTELSIDQIEKDILDQKSYPPKFCEAIFSG